MDMEDADDPVPNTETIGRNGDEFRDQDHDGFDGNHGMGMADRTEDEHKVLDSADTLGDLDSGDSGNADNVPSAIPRTVNKKQSMTKEEIAEYNALLLLKGFPSNDPMNNGGPTDSSAQSAVHKKRTFRTTKAESYDRDEEEDTASSSGWTPDCSHRLLNSVQRWKDQRKGTLCGGAKLFGYAFAGIFAGGFAVAYWARFAGIGGDGSVQQRAVGMEMDEAVAVQQEEMAEVELMVGTERRR